MQEYKEVEEPGKNRAAGSSTTSMKKTKNKTKQERSWSQAPAS